MVKITHPSMRGAGVGSSVAPQSYVVENAEEQVLQAPARPTIDDQLKAFEPPPAPQVFSNNVPHKQFKKKLEDLLFVGKLSKTIEVAGHVFELSTLTQKEHEELTKEVFKIAGADSVSLLALRTLTLAKAIKSFDGVGLNEIDVGAYFENDYDHQIYVVSQLQLSVIEKLHKEYDTLQKESRDLVVGDEIKK